ncbi:hypothetical protein OGAPHI_001726 [Ogataea philodendri]|uniref:BZIP domain-containing protein n=1 Tax=Ogataea philodendri TaxID=1378263 RepID=A0A9P8P9V8_9ASCO|nr:uncharacterized protein OGAPHI_001726 [Ogataea philodendri]KAH3667972.1 hypothetical protein OGAPHI_001726 [Ogataea philodendri]
MTSLQTDVNNSVVGSPTSNGSGSARKTLDLEPNPFEQSFAGPTDSAGSGPVPKLKHIDKKDARPTNASPTQQFTPGGTRRTFTSNVLPPLLGILSPGASSVPGTPGIWSSMFQGPSQSFTAQQSQQLLPFAYPMGAHGQQPGVAVPTPTQQQMYSQLISNAKKTGLTPNESSLRTGLTPGSNNIVAPHLAANNSYSMLMPNAPLTPGGLSFLNIPPAKPPVKQEHASQVPNPEPKPKRQKTKSVSNDEADKSPDTDSKQGSGDDQKRKSFLERNRIAASKCRQRKKQMVQKMTEELNFYSSQYEALTQQVSSLQDQVKTLHSIVLTHKDCPSFVEQMGGPETMNNVLGSFNGVHLLGGSARQAAVNGNAASSRAK